MIGFFEDSGLSTLAASISAMQASNGSSAAVDRQLWLGCDDVARAYYAASDPGVDDIVVSISDDSGATELPPTALRMAFNDFDLGTATPGAALTIGTEVGPGSANAVSFWVRIDSAAIAGAVYDNLRLTTNPLISQDVA
jgi:hypothetical protein